jgi:hypothetical protein
MLMFPYHWRIWEDVMDVLKEDFLLVPPFFGDLLFFAGLLLLDLVILPVFVK